MKILKFNDFLENQEPINENLLMNIVSFLTKKIDPNVELYFNDLIQNNFSNYTIIYDEYKQEQKYLHNKTIIWGIKELNIVLILVRVIDNYNIIIQRINGDITNLKYMDNNKTLLATIPHDHKEYELHTLSDFKDFSDEIINDIKNHF